MSSTEMKVEEWIALHGEELLELDVDPVEALLDAETDMVTSDLRDAGLLVDHRGEFATSGGSWLSRPSRWEAWELAKEDCPENFLS